METVCPISTNALSVAHSRQTTTTLIVFVLAMLNYPDIMHRAQQEIDAIVGQERLPTFDDHDELVYVQAIICEALRWRPPAPLGVRHISCLTTRNLIVT